MSTPAVVNDPQPGLSEGARLINTFVAPSKTFTDLRRNASWWVPWLLMSVFAICFLQTVGAKLDWEQVAHNDMQASGKLEKFEQAPPEQQKKIMGFTVTSYKVASWAAPVTVLLAGLIVAAVLMGLFNFGAGAEVTFKQSMAVVFYAWMPSILSSVLGIVSVLVGASSDSFREGFTLKNPVATNPAYFMDPTKNRCLYGMASAADVFVIWIIILAGIGYSSVSKLKKGTAIGMIAAAYIVYKLIASGISAM